MICALTTQGILWAREGRRKCETPVGTCPYPQDLSGDVRDPVLLERVALGVLHQVRDGPRPTELHHQLRAETHTVTHTCAGQAQHGLPHPRSRPSISLLKIQAHVRFGDITLLRACHHPSSNRAHLEQATEASDPPRPRVPALTRPSSPTHVGREGHFVLNQCPIIRNLLQTLPNCVSHVPKSDYYDSQTILH